jgi:hypothetical protein
MRHRLWVVFLAPSAVDLTSGIDLRLRRLVRAERDSTVDAGS